MQYIILMSKLQILKSNLFFVMTLNKIMNTFVPFSFITFDKPKPSRTWLKY